MRASVCCYNLKFLHAVFPLKSLTGGNGLKVGDMEDQFGASMPGKGLNGPTVVQYKRAGKGAAAAAAAAAVEDWRTMVWANENYFIVVRFSNSKKPRIFTGFGAGHGRP
jgi:hypothetical protein